MEPSELYMLEAIKLAKHAFSIGEVPVGAVIVQDDKIIARSYNRRETGKNALAHAEIIAINQACQLLGGWRLPRCQLYVTLEPCPMCAGAIIHSRIEKVYFGAYDEKGGACGSLINVFAHPFNHIPSIQGGLLQFQCQALLTDFFKQLRLRKGK